MGAPTIYRLPTKNLPPRPPKEDDRRKWEKRQEHTGNKTKIPTPKSK